METNFNIGSLKIVKTPLMEYFRLIQANLNDNIQLINDKKIPVNFDSIEILKKVSGTLKMIGLFGVNKVLSLVNESLESVKSANYDSTKSLAVLQASSKMLSSVGFYLDKLLAGEQDQPTKFFDEYSALSKLIGKESNIKELFTPKLEFRAEQASELQTDLRVGVFINSANKEKLVQTLKNSHETIQSSVAALFDLVNKKAYSSSDDKARYQNVIRSIYSALDNNQKLKLSKNIYLITALQKLFVSIISPVFNDNFEELVSTDLNSIKINLAKIERSSKFILDAVTSLDDSEKTGSIKVDDDVSREILFFIIAILSKEKNAVLKNMPIYQELSSIFNIDFYSNQLKETNIEVSISQKSPEIATQIEKIFVEVKEELSLLTSKNASNEDFALQHSIKFINNINKFSELMSGVSSTKLKQLISLISTAVTAVKNKEIQFSETLQKEISVSLVLVEYGINNFVKSIISDAQKIDFEKQSSIQIERLNLAIKNKLEELSKFVMPVLDSNSQKSDERKAFLLIFDKLHKDLRKAEEILNDVFRDTSNTEDLEIVIKTLNSAKGIFSIINKDDLSKVVNSIINIWKQVASSGFDSVNTKERSESVALLSGILLFIEASKNDNESEANAMYAQIMSRVNPVEVHAPIEKVENPNVLETFEFNPEEVEIEEPVQVEPVLELVSAPNIEMEEILEVTAPKVDTPVVSSVEPEVSSHVNEEFVDHSDDPDLTEVYLMEAEEVLENISQSTKALAVNSQDLAEVTNIRRYFHTLKGSGRMVGLLFLGEVAWMVEQTLNKVMNSDTELSPEMLVDLNTTKRQFDSWINELKNTNEVKVDLVTFKKMWIKHNSHITNQIEINIDAPIAEVHEVAPISHVAPIEIQEEIALSNEITFDDIPSVDSTPVVEKHVENEDNTISFEDFSLEEDKVEDISVKNEVMSLEPEAEKVELIDIHQPSIESTMDILDELNEAPLQQVEEISQELVEEKKDTVNINGVEVSNSLYQLFKEESDNHLQELRNSTHNHVEFEDGFEITQDFMRHAHTLASIAKSVNMNEFSNIVAKIEFIANICIDKKIKLNENDFFVLKNAVDNLDVFANVLDDSLEDNQHYETINGKLDSLLNSLTNLPEEVSSLETETVNDLEIDHQSEEMEEEMEPEFLAPVIHKNEASPASQVDIGELVSAISNNIAGLFKANLESLKESLESVKDEINTVKNDISNTSSSQQEIDIDGLINSINERVMSAVDEQYDKLTSVLREKDSASNEQSELLTKNIASLANELEVLNKNQQNIEKLQKENHEAIKKDLRYLNYAIKKKHSVSYREVAEETDGEIKEVQSLIAQEVEAISFEDTQNNEEVTVTTPQVIEETNNSLDIDISEHIETVDENISPVEEFDVSSEMSHEDFTAAQEDLNFKTHEVVENLNPNQNEEFEGLDDLPSDLEEKEKIKNINETLTTVKSNNSIVDFLNNNEFVKTIFEEKISTVEDEVDEEIVEISKDETKEILESVDNIMESINDDVLNLEQNDELKRLLHTLKGSVRMAGINKVGAIAHRLESLLDYSESRGISLFKMKDLLEDELNKINYLLDNLETVLSKEKAQWLDGNLEVTEEVVPSISYDLNLNPLTDVLDAPKVIQPVIKREEKQFIKIGANLIDALINEAGEVRLTRTTLEGMLTNNRRSLAELRVSASSLLKHLKEIEVQAEIQIAATREKLSESKDFDPLEFDRFTRLQEVTRFMNESVSDVQDTVNSMETVFKTQDGAVVQQAILTNNLLDTLMKVRLLPVDNISDRLYKITRATSKELNKKVTLELFGEKTEMDRLVLDKIISPLEHLLRNCIAHGIEEPAERAKKGKSVLGKVVMRTSVDGNFIVMNIKDDGAGINVEKVRSLGLKKGLLKYGIEYSEQQIIELIFSSGFSTSDTISQVSGRGVGMDVVKKEISELGGSIDIKTEKDKGTEFNIVLPVAVATNQAMLTEIAGKLVAIPALIVDEVSSLKKDKMQSAYMSGHVEVKGVNYPLYYLGHMLGLVPSSQLPELKVYNTLIAVTYLGETVVVHVDELQTTSEILIKTMGVHFNKISGVLGATLLGDGRQGLVINPVMLKAHYEQNIKNLNIFNEGEAITTDKMTGVITVMVVDDSVTVRRATTKVLERYGYNIVLAKDGEDGLEQLQVVIPDIILSDIEMPRMDGFEFAKNVKNTEKYAHIPIVMITSRTADKHKNYAYSLGVDGFLGKPYKEEELIETIKKLVGTLSN